MRYKAIIADDEVKLAELIERLGDWEALGIEIVDRCTTGTRAYESILKNRPDLVLSDIKMPGMDGLELITRVREAGADPLFILISGYRHFEYARTAVSLNVMDYLLKPVDGQQLNDTLQRVCRRIDQKREQEAEAQQYREVRQEREKVRTEQFFHDLVFKDSGRLRQTAVTEQLCNDTYGTVFRPGCYRVLFVYTNLSAVIGGNTSVSGEKLEKCLRESFPAETRIFLYDP